MTTSSRHPARSWAALLPMLALLSLVMIGPIVLACLHSLGASGAPSSLRAYRLLLDSSFLTVFARTVGYAFVVAAGCLLFGLPLAYALLRTRGLLFALLLAAVVLPFAAGSLVRSYAWLALLGRNGVLNMALLKLGLIATPLELAYRFPGLIAASIQVQIPIFVLPVFGVMRRAGTGLNAAAKSLGADPITAWFTAFLPAIASGVGMSSLLVFLSSLGFYVTPVLLGPPDAYLLSQELEVRLNTLGDQAGASARIVVMLLTVAVALALGVAARRALTRQSTTTAALRPISSIGRAGEAAARLLSPMRWWLLGVPVATVVLASLGAIMAIAPLGLSDGPYLSFPPPALSGRWIADYLTDYDMIDSTIYSLTLAGGAAMIATAVGAMAAIASLSLGRRAAGMVAAASAAPLVVPSILTAAALFLAALYVPQLDPTWLFLAIYVTLGLPFSYLVVHAAAQRIDPQLGQAAQVAGARPLTIALTVQLPLLVPSLLASFLFAFLIAFDDVSAGLFLSTSDRMPLAMRLWQEMADSLTPLPAAVALFFLATASIAALLAWALSTLGRRVRLHRSLGDQIAHGVINAGSNLPIGYPG